MLAVCYLVVFSSTLKCTTNPVTHGQDIWLESLQSLIEMGVCWTPVHLNSEDAILYLHLTHR